MSYRKTYKMRIDELNSRIDTIYGIRFGEFDSPLKTPDKYDDYDEFRFAYDFDSETLKVKKTTTDKKSTGESQQTEHPKIVLTRKQRQELEDDILEYLIFAYTDGIEAVNKMLTSDLAVDQEKLFESVGKKTAGESYKQRLDKHIENGDVEGIRRVAETEFHRVFNDALTDGGKEAGAKTKRWETMEDDRVRETHEFLQGVTVPFDEKFFTIDGDSALQPSGFELSENNVNCRCYIELSY